MSEDQYWITYSFMEKGRAGLPNKTSDDDVSEFEESDSDVELASNVTSHMGVQVDLIISSYVNCPLFPRVRRLLCLEHMKWRLKVAGLVIELVLVEVKILDGSPSVSVSEESIILCHLGEELDTGGMGHT